MTLLLSVLLLVKQEIITMLVLNMGVNAVSENTYRSILPGFIRADFGCRLR